MSRFRVSIHDTVTGAAAHLVPGGQGERDLVAAATKAIVAKGVGMFRTEAQVKAAIEEGLQDVLRDLKSEVKVPSR